MPDSSPQSGPAMSPAQFILSGGAGVEGFEDACAKVFAQFDPPIVCGTYSGVSQARRDANNELGSDSPYRNCQSEHMIANSAFQGERGNVATNIPGASGYSEGSAFAYSVYDDQSAGTEHKFLTDAAKDYDLSTPGNPSVGDRLSASEKWTSEMLDREDLQRTQDGPKRSRVADAKNKPPKQRKELCDAAAKCLSTKAEGQLKKQGIANNTPTRRGFDPEAPEPPPPKPPKRARF